MADVTDQDQEEFSSVVIPIFTDFLNTNVCQESQVDTSFSPSSPTEAETPLPSVLDQIIHSEPAENQSQNSGNKRPRLTDLGDDSAEDETLVEVMVADWINSTPPASTDHGHNQDEDAMWDDRLTSLVNEMEEVLRDEEGMFDVNDDEMTEISESMTFGAEHVGNDTLTETNLSKDKTEKRDAAEDIDKKPLYPTATVSIGTIMVLLALFTIKHNLPAEAIGNLLSLISLALPSSHCLPNTVNKFKTYFKKLRNPLRIHYYCSFCLQYTPTNTLTVCPNAGCLQDLTKKNSLAYFVEIPILQQLRTFFARPTFYEDLQYRFKRKKKVRNNIEDIHDGKLYKELSAKGILNDGDNISLLMNTDGVPVFKSSKVSIWPLYYIINELEYGKRMARENMLFAGLWFGEKKPAMWTFLKPHMSALKELESGVEFESPSRGKFVCKALLLACTCDLPARCLVCNSMQYNGEYGCWKCLQPGKTVKTGPRGHARGFPFNEEDPKGPPRTNELTLKHAEEAMHQQMAGKSRYVVNGVKGFSWLSILQHHDIIRGTAIDYMHGVLLGVQKLLLNLWFSNTHSKEEFSLYNLVSVVDQRLKNISPTLDITRLPRSISEHLKYWKANELRSFLLYYGLPVLHDLLPDKYFEHYFYFVRAIYLLLQDSISEAQLTTAEQLLEQFCRSFAKLYQERYATLNVHQLLHLVDNVKDLGPLFTHSCFSFEDKNGFILRLIHGTQFIDSQILTAVSFTQKLPELKEQCITPGSVEEKLYYNLLNPNKPKRKAEILPHCYLLGSLYRKGLSEMEFKALETFIGHAPTTAEVNAFNRIELNNSLIYGLDYKRMFRRNCSTVKYCSLNSYYFGQVKCFCQLSLGNGVHNIAFVYPLECCAPYDPTSTHIIAVKRDDTSLRAVDIRNISRNCIYMEIVREDATVHCFVCEFPNKIELD